MSKLIGLSGLKFGNWTVMGRAENGPGHHTRWRCSCVCGRIRDVDATTLRSGRSRGCLDCLRQWPSYEEIPGDYWYGIVRNANGRNYQLSITIEDAWNVFLKQQRRCALSGLELTFDERKRENDRRRQQTASLDRIDSLKGYTIENIQWVHKSINIMKNDLSEREFIDLCVAVAECRGIR
jgi:hypothetical protein